MNKNIITMFAGNTVVRYFRGERKEIKHAIAEGFLTKDPEIKEFNGYTIVENVSIGCNQNLEKQWDFINGNYSKDVNYGENKGFISLKFWNKQAESIAKLGFKGQRIIVFGGFEKIEYTSKEDNSKKSFFRINVEGFKILTFKKDLNEKINPEITETDLANEFSEAQDAEYSSIEGDIPF